MVRLFCKMVLLFGFVLVCLFVLIGVVRYVGCVELTENSLPDLGVSGTSSLVSVSHSSSVGALLLKQTLPV